MQWNSIDRNKQRESSRLSLRYKIFACVSRMNVICIKFAPFPKNHVAKSTIINTFPIFICNGKVNTTRPQKYILNRVFIKKNNRRLRVWRELQHAHGIFGVSTHLKYNLNVSLKKKRNMY